MEKKNSDERVGIFDGLFWVNGGHFSITLRFSDNKCFGRKQDVTTYIEVPWMVGRTCVKVKQIAMSFTFFYSNMVTSKPY